MGYLKAKELFWGWPVPVYTSGGCHWAQLLGVMAAVIEVFRLSGCGWRWFYCQLMWLSGRKTCASQDSRSAYLKASSQCSSTFLYLEN
jgi:hypothetical protein